jgi:hypothetical protein
LAARQNREFFASGPVCWLNRQGNTRLESVPEFALTVEDMSKAVDKDSQINNIPLLHNAAGKVVHFIPYRIEE